MPYFSSSRNTQETTMTEKELLEREALLEDILDALEDGDYEEAEDIADEAIELFPNEAFGYYYMGEAMFMQGDVEDAIDYYQRGVKRAPQNVTYRARLALMYAKIGEDNRAKQLYKSVLKLNDRHVDTLVALGVYAVNDGTYEIGLKYLNRAIDSAPDEVEAYRIRAILHANMDDYSAALADINKALEALPNDTELWLQKINLHDLTGDKKATIQAFEAWVVLDTDDANRYAKLGDFYERQQDYAAAETAYTQAIEKELYGDYAAIHSYLSRGWTRYYQDKLVEAKDDFNTVIDLDAQMTTAYLGLAETSVKAGHANAAQMQLDLGIDVVAQDAWVLYNKKGVLLAQDQNWDAAKAAFDALVQDEEEEIQAEGYFSLGKLYQMQDDLQAAYLAWKQAAERFHLEAEACIEEHCQVYVEADLQAQETALLEEMQDQFKANAASPVLKQFFGNFWGVDMKATKAKNKMFAQVPPNMEQQIMQLLENIALAITPNGLLVLNPNQDSVRMLYDIDSEENKLVQVHGVPLDGRTVRNFGLRQEGNYLVLNGIGEEDADIDLYLGAMTLADLPKPTQSKISELDKKGALKYLGDTFKL